jgi:hypothetical protein
MDKDVAATNEYTAGIAGFVAGLRYEDISGEVIALPAVLAPSWSELPVPQLQGRAGS